MTEDERREVVPWRIVYNHEQTVDQGHDCISKLSLREANVDINRSLSSILLGDNLLFFKRVCIDLAFCTGRGSDLPSEDLLKFLLIHQHFYAVCLFNHHKLLSKVCYYEHDCIVCKDIKNWRRSEHEDVESWKFDKYDYDDLYEAAHEGTLVAYELPWMIKRIFHDLKSGFHLFLQQDVCNKAHKKSHCSHMRVLLVRNHFYHLCFGVLCDEIACNNLTERHANCIFESLSLLEPIFYVRIFISNFWNIHMYYFMWWCLIIPTIKIRIGMLLLH